MKTIALLLALQAIGVLVIAFGDIGFDHPGRFGLDFGHFLVIAALELIAFITIGLVSYHKRRPAPVLASCAIVTLGIVATFTK